MSTYGQVLCKQAERVINRLMSSDPQFDDCADAADLIRRLVAEYRALSMEPLASLDAMQPRFPETFCSSCGKALGPGDAGVSHCGDHR